MDGKEQRKEVKNPRAKANFFSALTYSWVIPTFWLGYRRDLQPEDLYSPLDEHTSSLLGEQITKAWDKELDRVEAIRLRLEKKKAGGKSVSGKAPVPSLLRVLLKCFGVRTLMYGIGVFLGQTILGYAIAAAYRVIQPLLIGRLLRFYSSSTAVEESETDAYLYTTGIILCSFFKLFVINPYLLAVAHIGMKLRIACCTLIYRKTLKLSKTALGKTTIGQAVNLLSNDVNRFDQSIQFLQFVWIAPLQSIITTYFMYMEVGVSAIIGVAALLIFIPLQGFLGKRASVLRLRTAIRTDERIRLTNEIISGIQAIKMYTWEKPFGDLVQKAREREVNVITAMSDVRGIVMSFLIVAPRLSLFITLLAYVLLGNNITAENVFVLSAYFIILREAMTIFFPQGLTQGAETLVSIRRLQNFMMHDEVVPAIESVKDEEKSDAKAQGDIVHIKNGSAKWLDSAEGNTLSNIDLKVISGQLVAVIGQVGSGKSSLLHTILGEMLLNSGTIKVRGKIAYASQEPWLFAGSVRQNILFGSEMEPKRYEQVVRVCQLKRDFTLFPYGDKTIVGDRGTSLSGGQRARINLARAVYANADIYLMDDPLSAVDAHVSKHMFEECIAGYLEGKTRILVTHQLQYLKNVDRIVVLKNGAILAQGNYQELQANGIDLGGLLESTEEDTASSKLHPNRMISRFTSVTSGDSNGAEAESQSQDAPPEASEIRSVGKVAGAVYGDYIRAGGNWCVITVVTILVILCQGIASYCDYFISLWADLEEENTSTDADGTGVVSEWDGWLSRDLCIYIYTGLIVGVIVITIVRSASFFRVCMHASKQLHDKMFRGISRASMHFFNTNSEGRILNRFSKDMGAIDEILPTALIDCLQIGLGLLAIVIIIGVANPWLMIPTAVMAVLFYYFRVVYLATSRSVKRLEGVTRSPVFAHLSATIQGLSTIRAFEAGEILTTEFDRHQDLHSSAWFIFLGSTRLFVFWLDFVCVIYLGMVAYSFLVLPNQNSSGGDVGLSITQSLGLTGMFQWGMRQSAELENQMTSVERVLQYSEVDAEPPLQSSPENKPDVSWPAKAKIEFKNFSMRYGPNENYPMVLKNLNFVVEPSQKIGIVGRTGAGKSSLVSALFRLAYQTGEILIDGVQCGKLGLHDLRSKISIIPQEPFLFSGTLRRNLDPFDEYPDSSLWQALEEVELKEIGLESDIAEGGSNLSVGQRQLVCLARAIVRNNPILILDEATANVDPRTDELIQKTIRVKFANCTVLTVAHRLNTVMDSDKVLVMDAGTVVEYDHPHVLLQETNGHLRGMVEQTGKSMASALMLVAKNNYRSPQESQTDEEESKV